MSRDDDLDLHIRGEDAGPQPRPTLGLEVGDPDAPRDPAPAPAGDAYGPDPYGQDRPRGPRLVTIVFGLVLLAITAAVAVTEIGDATVDPWTFVIELMIGVGVLLLAGSLRRRPD